jgi:hypothetical protein
MSVTMKSLLATVILFTFAINANAEKDPRMKADAQAIDAACKNDAAEVGCGGEVVGKGLLKCMHEYKESHKDHKFSGGCRDAMKKMKADKKEEKGDKK